MARYDQFMPFEIIGAGFGRTGTLSLKIALEQLGFDPCYHMVEVLMPRPGVNDGHFAAWNDFAHGRKPMDWRWLFKGYRATVDFPACTYYKELLEVFPQAKVILSTRDSEKWFKSWQALWAAQDEVNDPARLKRGHEFFDFIDTLRNGAFGGRIEHDSSIAEFHRPVVGLRSEPGLGAVVRISEGAHSGCAVSARQ